MNINSLKSVINKSIESKNEVGVSAIVTNGNKTVFTYSAGLADIENNILFDETTICRAYSCTKVATSVACMLLMERGMLDINWPIDRIYQEYGHPFYIRNGKHIPSPPITIRDLLNMTSGIAYPSDPKDMNEGIEMTNEIWSKLDKSIQNGTSMTTQDFTKTMGGAALMFPAGQEWMYGSSADILGAVIEKISDMELAEFMEKNIFEPLEMTDTAFFVPKEKRDRLSVLYECAGDNPTIPNYVNLCIYDFDTLPAFQSGGAGLFSTAKDYAKLGAALSSENPHILSTHTIDFMRKNGLSDEQKQTYNWDSVRGYGYGNLVRCVNDRNLAETSATMGSFGWDGWTGTYLLCDPEKHLSITIFLQRCGAGTTLLSKDFVNAVYANL